MGFLQLKTRNFERLNKCGLSFSELGFGAAPIGNLYKAISDDEAQTTLTHAWDAGVRYFDTAPLYGLGLSETRLNRFLRNKARDSYVLSTKIGRLLRPCTSGEERDCIGKFYDVPLRREVYDYSYDGTMRSIEFSLERLGISRIDIIFAHDLDVFNHGTQQILDAKLSEFMQGGYRALSELRDQGVIKAFGAGVNEWQPCQWMAERGDFDVFLLAGRYTLLEQDALSSFLPLVEKKGIGLVIGGPYNSGILATGSKAGAFYNYDYAPNWVLQKVSEIEKVCHTHGVRLVDAAFQFPLYHKSVLSVIPGGQTAFEMQSNLEAASAIIPEAFWNDLKSAGLVRQDAPCGKGRNDN